MDKICDGDIPCRRCTELGLCCVHHQPQSRKHNWVEHYAALGKPGSAEWRMLKDAYTSKAAELEAEVMKGDMKKIIRQGEMVALREQLQCGASSSAPNDAPSAGGQEQPMQMQVKVTIVVPAKYWPRRK